MFKGLDLGLTLKVQSCPVNTVKNDPRLIHDQRLLNQYGRLFLRNTTILFNPNPSLSQQTVLHRFSPCTLDTIVPNPKSNPLNIRKYFVFTENYGVHFGHGKTFCRKKTRVRCKKNRVPAEPYYSHPKSIFFPDEQFCSVQNHVHWTRIRRS